MCVGHVEGMGAMIKAIIVGSKISKEETIWNTMG
jgi:hypothetical protein